MKKRLAVFALIAGVGLAPPVAAHHSTSAYDYTKSSNLDATVKEFKWTNPHMFLVVVAADREGKLSTWNIECGTPNINVRHGWKRSDLQAGDKVSMAFHPTRDGTTAGTLITVKLADGRTLFGPGHDIVAPGS